MATTPPPSRAVPERSRTPNQWFTDTVEPHVHAHAHAQVHAHVHMHMPVCLHVAYVLTSLGLRWPHLLVQRLRLGGVARALLLPLDRLPAQPTTQLMHLLLHPLPVVMQRLGGPALLQRV